MRADRPNLFPKYAPQGAPGPGERGFRPPAARPAEAWDSRDPREVAETVLGNCWRCMDDPETFQLWHVAVYGADDGDGDEDDPMLPDVLDVPQRGRAGELMPARERMDLTIWIMDLAMAADPERTGPEEWGDRDHRGRRMSERVGRGGCALPKWLAIAVLQDMLDEGHTDVRLVNVDKDAAARFISEHHSQLPYLNPRGIMYAIGLVRARRLVAVATAGAPTGQWSGDRVDPRNVLELTRVASDGTVHGAASRLVARLIDLLARSKRGPGDAPDLFVTYQLADEEGSTYRALRDKGLRPVALLPGKACAGGARQGPDEAKRAAAKIRWEAGTAASPARWDLLGAAQ